VTHEEISRAEDVIECTMVGCETRWVSEKYFAQWIHSIDSASSTIYSVLNLSLSSMDGFVRHVGQAETVRDMVGNGGEDNVIRMTLEFSYIVYVSHA
jgi:hypothetical protein